MENQKTFPQASKILVRNLNVTEEEAHWMKYKTWPDKKKKKKKEMENRSTL